MNWVFDHIQLIIAVAAAVAWWLKQRRQANSGGEEEPRKEATFDDPELAERTRRIREEIQRKIEQRARGYANEQPTLPHDQLPPEPPPMPVARPIAVPPPVPAPVARGAATRLEAQRQAEILEQQAALAEQLRVAAEMKAAAARRVQFESQVSDSEQTVAVARGALAEDLRSPEALRRAFVLREILGPPVALRS